MAETNKAATLGAGDAVLDQGTKSSDPIPPAGSGAAPDPLWKRLGYTSEAELEKGHTELRSKMSKEGAPKAPVTPAKPEEAAAAVAKAGLDIAQLQAEYLANDGKITPETYAKLEAAGVGKEAVDGYIAGQVALAAQASEEFAKHVGGQEKLTQITDWAKASLSDEDKTAFDKVLDTGNKAAIRLALDGLKAKYEAANGTEPQRLGGEGAAALAEGGYESWAQATADMRDPRYTKDEAFRARVEQKLARSKVI